MTAADWIGVYGALLATGLAIFEIYKYFLERPRLKVRAYLAGLTIRFIIPGETVHYESAKIPTGNEPFLANIAYRLFTSIWGETARDIRFGLGQLLSVWYLLTPVLYPLSQVPEAQRGWMLLNPLAIIVETFKWGLFEVGQFYRDAFAATAVAVVILLGGGLLSFLRAEARTIAEH